MMLSLFGSECSPSLRSIGRDSVMTFGFASQRLRVGGSADPPNTGGRRGLDHSTTDAEA